jgi:GAF domain-containing protein
VPSQGKAALESLAAALGHADLGGLDAQCEQAAVTAAAVLRVDGAGLMLADDSGQLRLARASDEGARALKLGQEELGAGPGMDSTRRRAMVIVENPHRDARWPGLWQLPAAHGVRAVMSAPIWLHGRPTGNLNVFTRNPGAWSRAERRPLQVYAGVVGTYLRMALDADHDGRKVEQLRRKRADMAGDGAGG